MWGSLNHVFVLEYHPLRQVDKYIKWRESLVRKSICQFSLKPFPYRAKDACCCSSQVCNINQKKVFAIYRNFTSFYVNNMQTAVAFLHRNSFPLNDKTYLKLCWFELKDVLKYLIIVSNKIMMHFCKNFREWPITLHTVSFITVVSENF